MSADKVLRIVAIAGSMALVVGGVWIIAGWPWAMIAAGSPMTVFYLWAEAQRMRTPGGGD